jgi:hypothetical protein
MSKPALQQLADEVFEKKQRRRRMMAQVPVEEKFATLLKLQQLAFDIATSAGRKTRRPWELK